MFVTNSGMEYVRDDDTVRKTCLEKCEDFKQGLQEAECIEILKNEPRGVMAGITMQDIMNDTECIIAEQKE